MAAVIGKVNGVGFSVRDAESGSDNGGSKESVSEHSQITMEIVEGWMV